MTRRSAGRVLVAIALLVPGSYAAAQTSAQRSVFTTRLAAVADATVCACVLSGVSAPRLRDLVIVAVGRPVPIARSTDGRVELLYAPEVLPIVFSHRTADERLLVWRCGPRKYCGMSQDDDVWSVTAMGVGLLPIGGLLRWRLSDGWHVRSRVSAGGIRMSRPIPLAQGTKFNFLVEAALGAEVRLPGNLRLGAAVLVNHISNGGLSPINLGMDSRMLELGVAIAR